MIGSYQNADQVVSLLLLTHIYVYLFQLFKIWYQKSLGSDDESSGSQVVQEALSAERTVFSFALESHFYEKFKSKLNSTTRCVNALSSYCYLLIKMIQTKFLNYAENNARDEFELFLLTFMYRCRKESKASG